MPRHALERVDAGAARGVGVHLVRHLARVELSKMVACVQEFMEQFDVGLVESPQLVALAQKRWLGVEKLGTEPCRWLNTAKFSATAFLMGSCLESNISMALSFAPLRRVLVVLLKKAQVRRRISHHVQKRTCSPYRALEVDCPSFCLNLRSHIEYGGPCSQTWRSRTWHYRAAEASSGSIGSSCVPLMPSMPMTPSPAMHPKVWSMGRFSMRSTASA